MTDFWVCGQCRSLNRGGSKTCYSCHAPYAPYVPDGGSTPVSSTPSPPGATSPAGPLVAGATSVAAATGMSGTVALSGTVATDVPPGSAPIAAAPSTTADNAPGILGGLIGGLIGAVAATVVWYGIVTTTHIQAGIVAIAVGWIVGQAVVLAAGRASLALVAISLGFTLAALAVSQYLITVRLINDILVEEAIGIQLPILVAPADALGLLVDWFEHDPLTLLFWAIALFEAVVIPWRRAMGRPVRAWPAMPR